MQLDVAGLGNALMDALVVLEDDTVIEELGLTRGTMHPVDHEKWQASYERVRRHKVTFDSGGSCANTIATVGRLGGAARYCGQVGDDQMGHLYASLLEKACGSHALQFTSAASTGKCLSLISARDAERTMLTDLGAAVSLSSLDGFRASLRSTKIAHFEGYTLLGDPLRSLALEAMAEARQGGALISLDASDPFVVHATRDLILRLAETSLDLIFLNAEEARGLTGLTGVEAAQAVADQTRLKTVVVKLGRQGSVIVHEGRVFPIAAHQVQAVDTTGAGDAYAGGFLFAVSQGWDVARAGELASRVAALTVSQIGAVVRDADLLRSCLSRP